MKGWPHYDATFDLMVKMIEGTHVFQPSNRSQGATFNNIRQSQPTTAANPSDPPALPSTSDDHHSLKELPPQSSSPVVAPHSSSPSIMTSNSTKCKQSAHQSANSLPSFVNDFMSVLDADVSSHGQTVTSSNQQKVNGPAALLSTSEELKSFNSTIKDLLKSKEVNKRQKQWEQASLTEHQMKAMVALQKQEKSWLSFDHQIAMIDHFKLDLGTADAYITLDLLVLCRLWVMKQLMDMKYVVDRIDDEGAYCFILWTSVDYVLLPHVLILLLYLEECEHLYFMIFGDE